MSNITKPPMLDETGKAIVEALTQQEMTQTRIAEINAAAETAKAGIETKTNEQAARIPEVIELASDVSSLKSDLDSKIESTFVESKNLINPNRIINGKSLSISEGNNFWLAPIEGMCTLIINLSKSSYVWQYFIKIASFGRQQFDVYLVNANDSLIENLIDGVIDNGSFSAIQKSTVVFDDNLHLQGLITHNVIQVDLNSYNYAFVVANKNMLESNDKFDVHIIESSTPSNEYYPYFEPYNMNSLVNSPYAKQKNLSECEESVNALNEQVKKLTDDSIPKYSVFKPSYKPYDVSALISGFFSDRDCMKRKYATENSKTYYWDIENGSDLNDGLSADTAFATFEKVKTVLKNGDTLLIKRGSVIHDLCDFGVTDLRGLTISVYGELSLGNAVFDNLVVVDSDAIEKVVGYQNIYRISHHYDASKENTNNMQMFIDGIRVGGNGMDANGKANVSNKNITSLSDALSYLDSHINEVWFSGYDGGNQWVEGDYEFYFSIQDNPSSHTIEIPKYATDCLLGTMFLTDTDIRHINTRGSVGKDGWNVGTNAYMEDCHIYDHTHHGFLSFNGFQKMYNCSAESDGAIGYQFHYFGTSDEIALGHSNIYINCNVASKNSLGSAWGGHMGETNKKPFDAEYLIDCYAEGCNNVLSSMGNINRCYVDNLTVKDVECIFNCTIPVYVYGAKGSILGGSINSGWNFMDTIYAKDMYLKIYTPTGKYGLLVDRSTTGNGTGIFENCVFAIEKNYVAENVGTMGHIIEINQNERFEFNNCCVMVKSEHIPDEQNLYAVWSNTQNVKFTDTLFFNTKDNNTIQDTLVNCEIEPDVNKANEIKYFLKTMYVEDGKIVALM